MVYGRSKRKCLKRKTQNSSAPDFNQFYTVVNGYVEYCVQNPQTKLSDKEKDGLSEAEIKKKRMNYDRA